MTLHLKIDPGLEQRLREQAARRGVEPDSYAVSAIEQRLQADSRPSSGLPAKESELLLQINAGLSDATWQRFDRLVEKRESKSLTSGEHQELMQLTNAIEGEHARRMELLVQLAQLRGVQLETLMKELGIGPRTSKTTNG